MSILFLPKDKLHAWFLRLADNYTVYYPIQLENKIHYKKLDTTFLTIPESDLVKSLQKIRPVESLKGFFFNPKIKVAELKDTSTIDIPLPQSSRIIFGAKNCDLRPLKVHQKMYLENEFGEPFYQSQLEKTIIIAVDCPVPEQTCFCNLLGLKPYPEENADIIFSVIPNGYIFETSSEKGESLLRDFNHLFREARSEDLILRDESRKKAVSLLESINPSSLRKDLAKAIDEKKEEKFWMEHAKTCVECFGCLMVCPTCFCFLLYDTPLAENEKPKGFQQGETTIEKSANVKGFERYKVWDACYYSAYARVGGGMNPRAEFWKRFRNRFHCKFMNFFNDYNFNACSGCGRCFSVCLGKIDIRKILQNI
ncbi:MAG: 4Fe-4S dicluster domain-containing protein [candidate division WOR-3 bacterium]|nr:4Fe-4S dicluster domain-containing protein [candidate division WOR-3 bacterium]